MFYLGIGWKRTNLYQSDIDLLKSPNWMNDNLLNFCCDYMQYIMFSDYTNIKYVYPATSFIIIQEDDIESINDIMVNCGITSDKSIIFFPIVDSHNTHWSLLIFESTKLTFYIIDLIPSNQNQNAKKLISKIGPILGHKHRIIRLPSSIQTNDYDCGFYVVMNMRIIINLIKDTQMIDEHISDSLIQLVTEESIIQERERIKKQIEEIAKTLSINICIPEDKIRTIK